MHVRLQALLEDTRAPPRRAAAAHHPPRTRSESCHEQVSCGSVLRRYPSQEREFSNPVKWPTVPPTISEAQV